MTRTKGITSLRLRELGRKTSCTRRMSRWVASASFAMNCSCIVRLRPRWRTTRLRVAALQKVSFVPNTREGEDRCDGRAGWGPLPPACVVASAGEMGTLNHGFLQISSSTARSSRAVFVDRHSRSPGLISCRLLSSQRYPEVVPPNGRRRKATYPGANPKVIAETQTVSAPGGEINRSTQMT